MVTTTRVPVAGGVDVGSTNCKVVAIDADGVVVGRSSRPTPRDPAGFAIDAEALVAVVEEMVAEVCGDTFEVHAICAAGVGEDGVLVGSDLRPLTPALAWFDPRREAIFRELRPGLHDDESFDAESDPVRAIVGWAWSIAQPGAADASAWISIADFAGVQWARTTFLSDTIASRTGAWRSIDRQWSDSRVALTLGAADRLPPVVATGSIVGDLRSPGLHAAGLIAADAVTVAGGHDHPIGGWGVDRMTPGAILDSMGTAEVVVAQSPTRRMPRDGALEVAPGIRSDGTTLLTVAELARNVEWASQDPAVAAEIRDIIAGRIEPESVLDSGYFVPGRAGGGRPAYTLGAPHDPRARASAVLGAMAYAGRDAVERVRSALPPGAPVRLAGGWSRSPGWVEIKQAVTGYPAEPIVEPEVTAVGAALLAASARGWHPSAEAALTRAP